MLLTVKEVADYLKYAPITVYRLCKYSYKNKFPARKIGREWRIDAKKLQEWINK